MALKHGKRLAPFPEPPSATTSETLARKVQDVSSDEEEIGFVPHNRGNKLKRRANPITGGCRLQVPDINKQLHLHSQEDNEDEIRANFRRSVAASKAAGQSGKREVIQVRRFGGGGDRAGFHGDEIDGAAGGQQQQELSDDENPYANIRMNEILSPLETSTEILQRPQHCKLFKSPQLQIMAVHAMAMIEREKKVNKMMSRVALILQGDDPLYPELGYGMGEGCSTARMGMPDREDLVQNNDEWKQHGEDRAQVQKTLSLLMENIHCSNQYIELLSESRDSVNHVLKQKKRLWKKLKEKREKELRHRLLSKNKKNNSSNNNNNNSSNIGNVNNSGSQHAGGQGSSGHQQQQHHR
ncbi:hypothetical protein BGZ97_012791 [Linnemannia gamsii]|uniref:Transcriptional regulatory protein RXT2 N-terminal domain-containing protein n=1 Tax=Linnemannia gamsii TaxID=64522 RepID=A0A9P6R0U0_9FUNG|nr:hypothetical protein BGZ97_012791 [Linnemannia gamsii]